MNSNKFNSVQYESNVTAKLHDKSAVGCVVSSYPSVMQCKMASISRPVVHFEE